MHDPASKNRLLAITLKAVQAHPFTGSRPNPARIDGILDKLRDVWKRNPDLRLAQLVCNASGATQPCPEIYYLEDDALLRGLDNFESQEHSGES